MAKNNKMQQIVNNTNLEIYKAKAKTIFDEARKALANNEITMEDLLKLDLEFDKAVMGVVNCEKEKARLNNEEVQNKRLLDLAREIVYGKDEEVEDDEDYDECDDDEYEEDNSDNDDEVEPNVNPTFNMIIGAMFGF